MANDVYTDAGVRSSHGACGEAQGAGGEGAHRYSRTCCRMSGGRSSFFAGPESILEEIAFLILCKKENVIMAAQEYGLVAFQSGLCKMSDKKQKEILGKLSVILSNAQNRYGLTGGKEWKEYKKSLASIDVNDPDSYDKQLQNVFDKASAYMKGRKSLRGNNWAQEKFDIALASIAELSEAGEFAHNAAQALMDRTNEVRIGHDRNYQPKTLDEYRINSFSYNDPSKKIGTYSNQEINIYQDMNAEALKAITETRKEDYENTFI